MARRLSLRLEAIVSWIQPGRVLWDVGCDHGRVGLEALARGLTPEVVLIDESAAGMERLRAQVSRHATEDQLAHLRLVCGDARRLPPEPIDGTVVLAGLGRRTMMQILDGWILPNAQPSLRLVLQPEVEQEALKATLVERVGKLTADQEVVERGRAHRLFVVDELGVG